MLALAIAESFCICDKQTPLSNELSDYLAPTIISMSASGAVSPAGRVET